MPNALAIAVGKKLDEDLDLIGDLFRLIPPNSGPWRPDWPHQGTEPPFTVDQLVVHLLDSSAAICACFERLRPEQFQHFGCYRERLAANNGESGTEAAQLLNECRLLVAEGFAELTDADLSRVIPTYFQPEGEIWLGVVLNNWKHCNHHTMQLFQYLKLLGVPMNTRHLYRFLSR